jgi:hypothetical protein
MRAGLLAGMLAAAGVLLAVVFANRELRDAAAAGTASAACGSPNAGSRWSSASGGYVRTAVYGRGEDAWLMSLNGLAVNPAGDVVLFDASNAAIHVTDANLRPKVRFGRAGGGPGELGAQALSRGGEAYFHRNFVGAGETHIFVFDGNVIQAFRYDGAYAGQRDEVRRGALPMFTVRALHATPDGYMYGFDAFDIQSRDRKLQTWTVLEGGRQSLVHEIPVPPPPGSPGLVHSSSNQAWPVWTASGSCVVEGDGSSAWLLRTDIESGRMDTVPLPRHDVPEEAEPAEHEEELRALLRMSRGVDIGEQPPATALWRWAEVKLDPDGHIWINPWRPRAERGTPVAVFRIDPNGVAHRETMPAFPLGFGSAGVIYTRESDPETDEVLVVRYDRR